MTAPQHGPTVRRRSGVAQLSQRIATPHCSDACEQSPARSSATGPGR